MENEQSTMQQAFHYEVVQLRLQCLQLAASTFPHGTDAEIVASAQRFSNFLYAPQATPAV